MADSWFTNTVIYALDVETFSDSDGDGIGDFRGLRDKLDYVSDLGVGCLWLTPFYESPNRDNGYDVTDHCAVDPRLGTLADFDTICREVHDRGLRVVVDLVVNHTSDQHPWFRESRTDPASPLRTFYRWSAVPVPPAEASVFRDPANTSVWTFDDVPERFYRHQFYEFQPDLATGDPAVQRAIRETMAFWLDRGVDGFRVDAARHLGGRTDGTHYEETSPHDVLKVMRRFGDARRPGSMLMGESDAEPDHLIDFFGNGDELQLIQNFLLDNFLMLALAREESEPVARVLAALPEPPGTAPCQWANFLRNFDELDLERLSDEEREEVYAAFAPDPAMRIYGRGIRRRLAPMLGGDQRRIALAFSLLMTLP
ncbi:MAG TPA: alpha-amylase family glycosyl hydrolase, partial [Thermomicrobiales bacterium]|nr:alpha-amylase family glycosyl hydrolase [Thermomicrobiales bacterium]